MDTKPENGACSSSGSSGMEGKEMSERNGSHLVLPIWVLTVLVAFLFGSTLANIIIAKQAHEGARVQTETIRALNESVVEVRRSIAELTALLQDAQDPEREMDEDNAYHRTRLGGERI